MPEGTDRNPTRDSTPELDAEDAKLLTLARSARARTGSAEGAAVRDETGRTYVAGEVALPSLRLSALQAAVAAAASSGARILEAAAIVADDPTRSREDLACVRDLAAPGTRVHLAAPDGALAATVTADPGR